MAKKGKSTIIPVGGLDSDSEARSLAPEDYRYALNIRNGIAYINDQMVVTNVKGSVKVPYILPAGTNKCIGTYEDKGANTIIYFVWNDKHQDTILRYFPSDTVPYGTIEQLALHNFGWASTDFITGIDLVNNQLLYWTDRIMPRKLDIIKSALTGKVKTWNVFLPETITVSAVVNFAFTDMLSQLFAIVPVNITDVDDRIQIIADIAAGINADANSPVTAEACKCHLVFTEKVAGTVGSIISDQLTPNLAFLLPIVPDNWYGLTFTDRMADAGKWMPLYPVIPTFQQDSNYEPNYVRNKVFQFRLEYQYDNYEETALGVISQIPINNLGCDGTSNPLYNYIYINFNEPELLVNSNMVLIKKVTLMAREHNEGNWRSIIVLEPCDWLDTDSVGNLVCRYKFYGDIGGSGVNDALVAKQYDNVPITNGTQKFVKNRLNYGDVEIGRDGPDCVDAKPQMQFGGITNQKLYKVKFYVRICTYGLQDNAATTVGSFYDIFPTEHKYPFWNPTQNSGTIIRGGIFHDTSVTPDKYAFFGGGGFGTGAGGDFGIRAGMEDIFDQRIPEGGFPIYLAGTPYFGVSRQINIGLGADSNGALESATSGQRDAIGAYLYSGGDLYSVVELLIPDGEYIARVASNWCSFGISGVDKLAKGFAYDLTSGDSYQKTSTNVMGVLQSKDPNSTWLKTQEIKFTVSGADIADAGCFVIADLVPPWDCTVGLPSGVRWQPIGCYLYDGGTSPNTGSSDPNNVNFDGVSVERAVVCYDKPFYNSAQRWEESAVTDHNGFFFGIGSGSLGLVSIEAQSVGGTLPDHGTVISDTFLIYTGTLSDYYNKLLVPYTFNGNGSGQLPDYFNYGLVFGIVTTTTPIARNECSTFITGRVVDSAGLPVPGVQIVYEHGKLTTTKIDGTYELLVWGDMVTPNFPSFPNGQVIVRGTNRINDSLIFELSVFCQPQYPNGQELGSILIDPFGANGTTNPPPYSPTGKYAVPNFIINEQNTPSVKTHKRGGNYIYCIRLYDNLGRVSSPTKAFEMYVPFITEDVGKYNIEDFSGVVYPAGSFEYGKPSIKWVLDSTTLFPTWATKFQWMRVQNSIYGRYLQWVANSVTYISQLANVNSGTPEIQTSFENGDAIAAKVSISNLLSYANQNGNSQLGYAYQAGDRLRLMYDRNLNPINGLNDFEILSQFTSGTDIYIKLEAYNAQLFSGTTMEVFNTKTTETENGQLFYEVGEVVEIIAGIPQAFSGVFTNGDTYWRGRGLIVTDDTGNFSSFYPIVIEDAHPSDFIPWYITRTINGVATQILGGDDDIGRAAVIDPNFKQLRYPTRMQCSNVYIAGTTINGLASFESVNFRELPRNYGTMKRMFISGQVLLTVHENKLVSNYIELTTIADANVTDGLLAISDKYYGNNRPSQTDFGSQHGESCIEYNGLVWGLDASKGVIWQYDNNGDAAISKYKMVSFFKDFCVKGVEWCIPAYDKYRNELIFSIKNSEQTITIAYDNAKNRWSTFYSFTPEYFGNIGTNVVGFVNGELWALDKSDVYNHFFGQQFDSKLTIIPNDNSDLNKVWDCVKLESLEDANKQVNNWEVFNITNNNGQISRLLKTSFRKIEYFFWTSFKRDITDISVQDAILNGREMRSPYVIMEMSNNTVGQFQIRSIVVEWTTSERT